MKFIMQRGSGTAICTPRLECIRLDQAPPDEQIANIGMKELSGSVLKTANDLQI